MKNALKQATHKPMTGIKLSMVSISNVLLREISASRFLCNQRSPFSVEGLTAYRYGSTHGNIIANEQASINHFSNPQYD